MSYILKTFAVSILASPASTDNDARLHLHESNISDFFRIVFILSVSLATTLKRGG